MYQLFYKPIDSWVGDVIPYYKDGTFFLYFLEEKRRNGIPADRTTWNLIMTKNFIHYENKGIVLPAGTDDSPDRSCYTGSVIEDAEGNWHLFYTAQNSVNPLYLHNGRPLQYIAHAKGKDGIHWEKDPDFLLKAEEGYDVYDWRDPFVFYNGEGGYYLMLVAAKRKSDRLKEGGCLYGMKSYDLEHWEADGEFYAPETYMTHECPDCFKMGEWWYLIFSTFSEKYTTHYRMSRSLKGPWMIPQNDTFDGRAFYAAKTAKGKEKRYLFGWIPTKLGENDFGKWEWAGNMAVHELVQNQDGTLSVKFPDLSKNIKLHVIIPQLVGILGKAEYREEKWHIQGRERFSAVFLDHLPIHGSICMKITFSEKIASFGLQLHGNQTFDQGYFYRFEPLFQRVVFDQWPRSSLKEPIIPNSFENDRPFDAGLERPVILRQDHTLEITLLIDQDICVLYVDHQTALTVRCYQCQSSVWGFFAIGGEIIVSEIVCSSLDDF